MRRLVLASIFLSDIQRVCILFAKVVTFDSELKTQLVKNTNLCFKRFVIETQGFDAFDNLFSKEVIHAVACIIIFN